MKFTNIDMVHWDVSNVVNFRDMFAPNMEQQKLDHDAKCKQEYEKALLLETTLLEMGI